MSILSDAPVADVLARLYGDAARVDPPAFSAGFAEVQRAGRDVAAREYKRFFGLMKTAYMAVEPDFGRFLYVLARSRRAATIVEFGTSFGISAIFLAAALRDNGGGRLITTEFEPTKIARARQNLADAGLADLVEFREGDGLETLPHGIDQVDLVLLDGAKNLYLPVLKLLEPRLSGGALVAADNAAMSETTGGYLTYVRDPRNGYVSTGVLQHQNELSLRL